MKIKLLISLFCLAAMIIPANAQETTATYPQHSVGASWGCLGFNSTYSKNSDKKTFGTLGVNYECRFNKWISVTGTLGWTRSWFGANANPETAYPKKDNAFLALAGCNVTWLHKRLIEMYSGVAGGLDMRLQENDRGTYTTLNLAGQFDAVGLKFNWKHAYVGLSAGWGAMGCVRLGAGYKF